MREDLSYSLLRSLMTEASGSDPGELSADSLIDSIELNGFDYLRFISDLEKRFHVELHSQLLDSLETVGDLLYFLKVKCYE